MNPRHFLRATLLLGGLLTAVTACTQRGADALPDPTVEDEITVQMATESNGAATKRATLNGPAYLLVRAVYDKDKSATFNKGDRTIYDWPIRITPLNEQGQATGPAEWFDTLEGEIWNGVFVKVRQGKYLVEAFEPTGTQNPAAHWAFTTKTKRVVSVTSTSVVRVVSFGMACSIGGQVQAWPANNEPETWDCYAQYDRLPRIFAFNATPTTISQGGASTLEVHVPDEADVSIDQGVGIVDNFERIIVRPHVTTTYTLIAHNEYGARTSKVTVTVNGTTPPPSPSPSPTPPSPPPGPTPPPTPPSPPPSPPPSTLPSSRQTAASISVAGLNVPYLQYLPDGYASSGQSYPVMIFLHGIGERGGGTAALTSSVENIPPTQIAQDRFDFRINANGRTESLIVISPSLPSGIWDANIVEAFVDLATQSVRGDPKRVYLVGYSFGGGGVWNYFREAGGDARGRKVAAIVTLAGSVRFYGPNPNQIDDPVYDYAATGCNIAASSTPVLALHGLLPGENGDGTVDFRASKNNVDAINNCPTARSTVAPELVTLPGVNHADTSSQGFDANQQYNGRNIYQFLLGFTR